MPIYKSFRRLNRIVQIILLLIPIVSWITEILVRVSALIHRPTLFNIIGFIFGLVIPVFGWIDIIWCLLFKHMIFCS